MISAKCSPSLLPRLCSPLPPSRGRVTGCRVSAESHPRRSTRTRELRQAVMRSAFYNSCSTLFLPCGTHFLHEDCTARSLVLVLSLFSSYVIKWLFSFITLPDVWNSLISWYLLAGCRLHLGFLEELVLKVGFYLKAVFPSRNLGLKQISRSRFKQSENCWFVSRIYVLRSFVNIWMIFGDIWEEFFSMD